VITRDKIRYCIYDEIDGPTEKCLYAQVYDLVYTMTHDRYFDGIDVPLGTELHGGIAEQLDEEGLQ
jgi:hypothetical protein